MSDERAERSTLDEIPATQKARLKDRDEIADRLARESKARVKESQMLIEASKRKRKPR
jgi:hypothetical protein